MDHTTKHPGQHDFDGIRGKKPAHGDHHTEHMTHKSDKYHEGGHEGFSHQDGTMGESAHDEVAEAARGKEIARGNTEDAATSYGGAITVPKP